MVDFNKLAEAFPESAISWRAQSVTKDGTKALALAYIDARDVMNRLDAVCGVAGWQCEYPHANGKTICSIGIKCGDEWVWKADGAGDTDVEAEKGAISDAFKRAAVKWGIGRYLYDLGSPWVPCESYKSGDKFKWSKFNGNPWDFVKGKPQIKTMDVSHSVDVAGIEKLINSVSTEEGLKDIWTKYMPELSTLKATDIKAYDKLVWAKDTKKTTLGG